MGAARVAPPSPAGGELPGASHREVHPLRIARSLPPARSPLSVRALGAGLRGAIFGGEADRDWLSRTLRERYGALDVLLTDSGTSALRLALAASAARAPMALPAYSCYDLATAAAGAEVDVVLYDLVPSTLAPDPRSVERALAAGARVLVAAPLYGVPVDLTHPRALCARHDALLLEDAAQGFGASHGGRPLGAGGSLAVLSFARGKGWTGGGGGALLAHDARGSAVLDAARVLMSGEGLRPARGGVGPGGGGRGPDEPRGWTGLARVAAQWALGRPSLYGLPRLVPWLQLGDTVYREPWSPTGLPASAAAALRATEFAAREEARIRKENAERLLRAIRDGSRLTPIDPSPGSEPGWLRLPVLLPEGSEGTRDPPEPLGVFRGYPRPLYRLAALRPRLREERPDAGGEAGFPGAELLADRLATLPTHGALRARDMESLEGWIRDA